MCIRRLHKEKHTLIQGDFIFELSLWCVVAMLCVRLHHNPKYNEQEEELSVNV